MVSLGSLWLPIILASVVVFFLGFLAWTVLPHHKNDWSKIENDEPLLDAIRRLGLGRGQYYFPSAMAPESRKDPEAQRKVQEGPVGFLIVETAEFTRMGKRLTLYFVYILAVSIVVAYVASRTVAPGADYLSVFRVVGTVSFLAYGAALIPGAIFFGRTWSSIWKEVADAFVYGLFTAGVFGWLWPS